VLVLLLANGLRVFVFDLLGRELWSDRSVCFYYCAEARVLAMSGLLTVVIFLFKYCYALIRHRKRCVLLNTKLKYITRIVDQHPASTSGAASLPVIRQIYSTGPSSSFLVSAASKGLQVPVIAEPSQSSAGRIVAADDRDRLRSSTMPM